MPIPLNSIGSGENNFKRSYKNNYLKKTLFNLRAFYRDNTDNSSMFDLNDLESNIKTGEIFRFAYYTGLKDSLILPALQGVINLEIEEQDIVTKKIRQQAIELFFNWDGMYNKWIKENNL